MNLGTSQTYFLELAKCAKGVVSTYLDKFFAFKKKSSKSCELTNGALKKWRIDFKNIQTLKHEMKQQFWQNNNKTNEPLTLSILEIRVNSNGQLLMCKEYVIKFIKKILTMELKNIEIAWSFFFFTYFLKKIWIRGPSMCFYPNFNHNLSCFYLKLYPDSIVQIFL